MHSWGYLHICKYSWGYHAHPQRLMRSLRHCKCHHTLLVLPCSYVVFVCVSAPQKPPPGDKTMAKSMMQRADVPVVPGYHGESQDLDTLLQAAQGVGFPLLVKAAMGGGGKGMKLATHTGEVKVCGPRCFAPVEVDAVSCRMQCRVGCSVVWDACSPG